MSTIDWPEALIPQTCQLVLRKAGTSFASPFNGSHQALDFLAERWVLSVNLAQMSARNPRGVGSFCNRLAGGVERVRGWHFGHNRGVPRGTLRGTPSLGVAAARGDSQLTLAGAIGTNLMLGGSFEFDSNADGLADGWTGVSSGSVTGLTLARMTGTPEDGVYLQGVDATYTATGSTNVAGVERVVQLPGGPGPYTFLASVRGDTELNAYVVVEWRNSGGTIISTSVVVNQALTTSLVRVGGTATAPALTTQCTVRLLTYRTAGTTTRAARWDSCAVKAGTTDLTWPGAATLLADDMIGAGGWLFQVASNCIANDAGQLVVPVVNRVRGTIALASAVTWNRPTTEFVLPAMQAGPVYGGGAINTTALDLVEV